MLNGDAHHSSVWEVEPRILPLLNCQTKPQASQINTDPAKWSKSALIRENLRLKLEGSLSTLSSGSSMSS